MVTIFSDVATLYSCKVVMFLVLCSCNNNNVIISAKTFLHIYICFGGSAKLPSWTLPQPQPQPQPPSVVALPLSSPSPTHTHSHTHSHTHTRDNEVPHCCILSRSLGSPRCSPGCSTRPQHPVRFLPASPIPNNAHESSAALVYKNVLEHNSPGLEVPVPLISKSFLVRHCPHSHSFFSSFFIRRSTFGRPPRDLGYRFERQLILLVVQADRR